MIVLTKLFQKINKNNEILNCKKFNLYLFKSKLENFYSTSQFRKMKYLNVAEKHDAAKNISNILSNGSARRREGLCVYNKIFDFECNVKNQNCKMVMTSVSGHLLNYEFLPSHKGWNNCSPEQLFDAPIRKSISNTDTGEKIKRTIEREVKSCQGLIIWTDCDREGENIGFEIIEVCQKIRPNLKIFRAKFSEITRAGIIRAIQNLTQPDEKQNIAVNIRQELDLRTGAAFTRYQTLRLQKLFPGTTAEKLISYGSCQFPTLGFVAERYKEVEDFVSEPFWKLKVIHTIDELTVEFIWARNRLFNKEAVEDYLLLCLADPKAKVENKTVKPKNKWRPQPMDTVELEKLGSRKLKINAKETMTIAERLYNKGFISYPRTETNSFSSDVNLNQLVEQHSSHPEWGDFAGKVLQWGPNPRNGKKTDEAHPPIHPTKLATGLNGDDARVYELIVRHFLACISKDATGSETIVYIDIAGEKFSANGLVIYERNYLDVYPYEKWNAKQIHHYEIGQIFEPTEISMQEGATTAPPLLTEADLIVLMEKNGIGTDATHAEHIHTIKERGYIGEIERGLLVPGTIGMGLYEGYGAMDIEIAKPRLRAEFESDLKKICNGEKDARVVLREQISKYKELYCLVMQRINALDAKFASRVNEEPFNRRNNDDRDPGNGGNGSNRNNRNDGNGSNRNNRNDGNSSSDDDGDDGNNPPGAGGYVSAQNNYNNEYLPPPLQEVCLCPKCKISHMALKKKKEGNSYMIGCSNFPDCKNVVWLSDAIKEAKLSGDFCSKCGNKANEKSLFKKIEFKFKNNSYLAYLCSNTPTYTTCLRCDSKFREVFDINLDQVKSVGNIVGENVFSGNNIKTKPSNAKVHNSKLNNQNQIRNFSSNHQANSVENMEWIFNDDPFENDGFDDQLNEVLVNLDAQNETDRNNLSFRDEIKNTTKWKELKDFENKNKTVKSPSDNFENKSSKWINLNSFPDESSSSNNWFSTSPLPKKLKTSNFKEKLNRETIYNTNENKDSEIKCKTCSKVLQIKIVKSEGPNKGKKYYSCDQTCKFFQWKDEVVSRTNTVVSQSQWGSSSKEEVDEKCNCDITAILLQVGKDGPNKGRSFYTCSKRGCSFFKWADMEKPNITKSSDHTSGSYSKNKEPQSKTKISSKTRKCGLCRMEGHTKTKCPRKEDFGMN